MPPFNNRKAGPSKKKKTPKKVMIRTRSQQDPAGAEDSQSQDEISFHTSSLLEDSFLDVQEDIQHHSPQTAEERNHQSNDAPNAQPQTPNVNLPQIDEQQLREKISASGNTVETLISLVIQQQQQQFQQQQQQLQQQQQQFKQQQEQQLQMYSQTIDLLRQNQINTPSILQTIPLPPLDKILPKFSGRDEENPASFLEKFGRAIKSYNLPEDTWQTMVRSQLTESAGEWFDRNAARFASFDTFAELFEEEYDDPGVRTRLTARFYGEKQGNQENSGTFINNKIKLATKLFPERSDKELIRDLMELIHPSVDVHLLQAPSTIDELLRKVTRIDRNRNNGAKDKTTSKTEDPYCNQKSKKSETRLLDSPATNHFPLYNRQPERKTFQHGSSFLSRCRYCNGEHLHRDCPISQKLRDENEPRTHFQQPTQKATTSNNFQHQLFARPNTSQSKGKPLSKFYTSSGVTRETNYKCPSINISYLGHAHPVMIDTGANECFIRKSYLPEDMVITPIHEALEAEVATQEKTNILGQVKITFTLGKSSYEQTFNVMDKLIVPVILGVSWLEDNGIIVDFIKHVLIVGNRDHENIPFANRTTDEIRNTPPVDFDQVQHQFPPEHLNKFKDLIQEYADVFNTKVLQQTTATKHHIPLANTVPVYSPPFKLNPRKTAIATKLATDMLSQGLIEPSDSPYNSPIVIKEYDEIGKEPRFCVDYRKLNKVTVDQNCPSLKIQDLVRNIGDHCLFATIDLKKGYWQVPLADESKPLTAFSTPDGQHYQFKIMPFGLKGAPGTFIRLMSNVLYGLSGDIVEVYLDDLIIKAHDWTELLTNIRIILERLRRFKLTAHLSKCHFGKDNIKYLGHIITPESNQAPQAHITAIQTFPIPTTKRKLQSFLGTCNWLREYVPKASEVLDPLYKICTRKPFKWKPEENEVFQTAKDAFSNLQPLSRPVEHLPFVLQTDASHIGLGATLYQSDGESKKIIANVSASLSETERRYNSNEKECLAVLWAIRKFRPYLEGREFILRTDNRALLWLDKFKEDRSKLTRWSLTLQEYKFKVEHVPGSQNALPDALSRNPSNEPVTDIEEPNMTPPICEKEDVPSLKQVNLSSVIVPKLLSKIKDSQKDDEVCNEKQFLYQFLLELGADGINEEDKKFLQTHQVINSHLYVRGDGRDEWKLYVPQKEVQTVIDHYHADPLYCHPGTNATQTLITQSYSWPRMYQDIAEYIAQCDTCARSKIAGKVRKAPLRARIVDQKFHTWSIDLMGPYVPSSRGNRYLIVASDVCSKWVEAKPIRSANTKKIIIFLEEEVFSRFGFPRTVLTDNGPQFTSREWTQACYRWGSQHHTTAIYTARQNPVERRNQSIKDKLRIQLLDRPHKHWDAELTKILYSIRNCPNQAIGMSPAKVYFNQNLRHPCDESSIGHSTIGDESEKSLFTQHELANKNQKKYAEKYTGQRRTFKPFPNRSIVYLRNRELSDAQKGISAGLNPKWIGPYKITDVHPSGNYFCQSLFDPGDVRKVNHQDIQLRQEACRSAGSHNSSKSGEMPSRPYSPSSRWKKSMNDIRTSRTKITEEQRTLPPSVHSTSTNSGKYRPGPSRRSRIPNQKYLGPEWINQ